MFSRIHPIPAALLEALDFPDRLPSLWYGAPVPGLLALRDRTRKAANALTGARRGRSGILVLRNAKGGLSAFFAHEPLHEPEPEPGEELPAADRLVGRTAPDVFTAAAARIKLFDAKGERFTLGAFAEALFARRPERIARGGAAGLNLTHDHWRRALLDAPASPAAHLLCETNRMRAAGVQVGLPVAALEFWEGVSPAFDVKWDGMPLSPRTTVKPLVERLLEGVPQAPDPRLSDPAVLAKRPRILFENDAVVVIEKPSGLLSVPGTLGLADAMTLAAEATGAALTPVHRLDMDTSGLLVYSKTLEATKALMADFREGRVEKRYKALLRGEPAGVDGSISLPLTTHPLDRLRQIAAVGGRPSITRWKTLGRAPERTLVELEPVTGRTHQLRVHCAHVLGLSSPIIGDPYYGPEGLSAETPETPLCLHAARLVFTDPASGRVLRFETEPAFSL